MTTYDNRGPRFNILGPLEGWADGKRLRLGGAIHQRILAGLLLEAGRTVPVTRLVQAAWNDGPPATATHQVRKAVAELRRRIPGGSDVVVTDGPGYRVVLDEGQLDLTEFSDGVRRAVRATEEGQPARAADALHRALDLWRGPALSGTGSDLLESVATTLEERRVAAAEQLAELRLAAGETGDLVADLRDLVARYPLRETLRGHLMLALYRGGRQAEALEEYGKVRDLLVEELGIDPSSRLSGLYEAILREAPELRAQPAQPAPALAAAPTPRLADGPAAPSNVEPAEAAAAAEPTERREHTGQPDAPKALCTLPYGLTDFTGRERELTELLAAITGTASPTSTGSPTGTGSLPGPAHPTGTDSPGEPGRTSGIVAIDGMGGSGKTSLAVHAAHKVAAEFPDGQLHIDLRGFTPGETPVPPGAALDGLLRALGTPGDHIPDDAAGRSALWRSTLAGRRVLLLLDNAADAAQVLPLLPASPGCLVLVTSRERLVDLDGAEWISVGPMLPEDGTLLLEEVLGRARVAAEPQAAEELVRLCGRLPLALRIVAARLRNRPRWTVGYLADRLRDETHRLAELSAGERSVAATLQLSYQAMDEEHRAAFRILGLHPGADVDAYAAAALLDTDTRSAEAVLERLLDVHLLQQPDIGLYRFHDLVRTFAQDQSRPATEGDDTAAVRRLLDYYLTATEEACSCLFPGRSQRLTQLPPYEGEIPRFTGMEETRRWFDHEHTSLVASVSLADRHGLDRHTVSLTRNIVFRLNALGRFEEFKDLSRIAATAARRTEDLAVLGVTLSNLSVACWKLGHLEEGIQAATEGRDIAARLGDQLTEAHGESTIGLLLTVLGQHAEALPRLERALCLERALRVPRAEAETLTNLSTLYAQWGRYDEAAAMARAALTVHDGLDYRDSHVMALTDLAFAQVGLGAHEEARDCLRRARERCHPSSPPGDVALALALSAEVEDRFADADAAHFADEALRLARASGTPTRQAKVENLIGRFHARRGDHERAALLHRHAHELAAAIRYRAEEAGALYGMADAAEAAGDTASAARHRSDADALSAFMERATASLTC
ncbi:AfsR/SARP family transcriptional regulator [Streptomyces violascens]|uniref:AfsR/SARP family transcriptional regulator n=1 Tax=Streptomyces violascens TaxID=67381 RepID=UPI0037971793